MTTREIIPTGTGWTEVPLRAVPAGAIKASAWRHGDVFVISALELGEIGHCRLHHVSVSALLREVSDADMAEVRGAFGMPFDRVGERSQHATFTRHLWAVAP